MDCALCQQFQASTTVAAADVPLCGACVAGIGNVDANPTDINGRDYNSAKSVTATCASRRMFLGEFATELNAFGVTQDNPADNVNDNLNNCIQNCPK
jgi:hypothetical protein